MQKATHYLKKLWNHKFIVLKKYQDTKLSFTVMVHYR